MPHNGFDHFALFGLPPRFAVDEAALTDAYQRVQAQVHPDRFAAGSAAERRIAAQWAARANEAVTILRSPLRRAIYLCESNGVAIGAETNTAMPAEFLMRQMAWREALDDARHGNEAGSSGNLQELTDEVAAEREALIARIAQALDHDRDYAGAAELARQLMFVERFGAELREGHGASETRAASEAPAPRVAKD